MIENNAKWKSQIKNKISKTNAPLSMGRVWEPSSNIEGTFSVYAMDPRDTTLFPCHVSIRTSPYDDDVEMLRSYRLWRDAKRKAVPEITDSSLQEEAVIIWAPLASLGRAIGFLEETIAKIKRDGLFLGPVAYGGSYLFEKLSGEIVDECAGPIALPVYKP